MSNNKQIKKHLELPHRETILGINTIQTKPFDYQKIKEMSNNKQIDIGELAIKLYPFGNDNIRNAFISGYNKAKAMHNEEKLTNYSDGYLEGFNRALDLVELTVEEYRYDIFYNRGLVKIHDRIKELRG